jgi:FtsP/CotA-like multicopper oxidase with cupredoxin domain
VLLECPRGDARRIAAMSRRGFLGAALAAGLLHGAARAASASSQRLVAGTRVLEVNGRPARVFGLVGPGGRPGIRLATGERFRVDLVNQTGRRTLVHWHGQLPPWTQDGFPWPQTPPIESGAVQAYDYAPIPGTYWMHSHHEMQEQALLAAPLIVRDAEAEREDRQEVVVILHDFTFRTPEEVFAGLTGPATGQHMPGMAARGMAMGGMAMPQVSGTGPDLNDVQFDAFLANDRTLADPEVVRVASGGRVRIRIINGASSSQFWIDLGGLTGRVVATDGHAVRPVEGRRFPLAMAQRLDILIDLPRAGAFPVLATLEGSPRRTGIVLATPGAAIPKLAEAGDSAPPVDHSLEARLSATVPLPARRADIVRAIALSGAMQPYAWSMNGELWPHVTPLMLDKGQRVEIELVNHSRMAHPMHLHGHAFQVIALDGRPIQGAIRDTVLVAPNMGRVRIAFDADNPGRWAFHCHNLYHMETGMMTEVRYQGISA